MDSLGYSFSEFGDYDSDGDLDLFAAGVNSNADVVSKIYDNLENINNSNKQPNQPYGLEVLSINKDQVHLSWQKANDGLSPFSGQHNRVDYLISYRLVQMKQQRKTVLFLVRMAIFPKEVLQRILNILKIFLKEITCGG